MGGREHHVQDAQQGGHGRDRQGDAHAISQYGDIACRSSRIRAATRSRRWHEGFLKDGDRDRFGEVITGSIISSARRRPGTLMSRRLTSWLLMLPGIGWLTAFMIVPCV